MILARKSSVEIGTAQAVLTIADDLSHMQKFGDIQIDEDSDTISLKCIVRAVYMFLDDNMYAMMW